MSHKIKKQTHHHIENSEMCVCVVCLHLFVELGLVGWGPGASEAFDGWGAGGLNEYSAPRLKFYLLSSSPKH